MSDRSSFTMIGDISVSQPTYGGERLLYSVQATDHNIIDIIEIAAPYPDNEMEIMINSLFVNAVEPPLIIDGKVIPQYAAIATAQGGGWVTVKEKKEHSFIIDYFNANHDVDNVHTISILIIGKRKRYGTLARMEKFYQEFPFEISSIDDLYWIGKGADNQPILENILLDLTTTNTNDSYTLKNGYTEDTYPLTKQSSSYSDLLSIRTALRWLYNFNNDIVIEPYDEAEEGEIIMKITFPPDLVDYQGTSLLSVESDTATLSIIEPYDHNYAGWTMDAYYKQVNDIDLDGYNFLIYPGPIGSYDHQFNGLYEVDIDENTSEPYKITNLLLTNDGTIEDRDIEANAFFGTIGVNGRVENLIIENSIIDMPHDYYVSTIASDNYGIIVNSQVIGDSIVIGMDVVGGIVAQNNGTIISCAFKGIMVYATGDVISPYQGWVGGFVGANRNNGYIEYCHINTLNSNILNSIILPSGYEVISIDDYNGVYSPDRAGGFTFINNGTIRISYTKTSVFTYDDSLDVYYIGGFAGIVSRPGNIVECYCNHIDIISYNGRIGGFVGTMTPNSLIENCYVQATNLITENVNSQYQGGFCGLNLQGNIVNSYSVINNFIFEGTFATDRYLKGFIGSWVPGTSYIMGDNFFQEFSIFLTADSSVVAEYTNGASEVIMKDINTYLRQGQIYIGETQEGVIDTSIGWNICLESEWGDTIIPGNKGKLKWFIDNNDNYPQLSIEHLDYWE